MHGSTASPNLGRIKVISSTGLYLQTRERWPIGEIVPLTLQKDGVTARGSELQVEIQARVASHGDDGVGLGFILPSGLNVNLWEHLIEKADAPAESEETQFVFRMVRAILFVYRLCPPRSSEPIYALTGELDGFRTSNMLNIALMAERMLASEPNADKLRVHPDLAAAILRDGSWQDNSLLQRLWAGLLVSSCNEDGTDTSNMDLVELLIQLTAAQANIMVEAYRRMEDQMTGADGGVMTPSIITHEEMISITGIYDVYRNATDIAYLNNFGLLENTFDFSTHNSKSCFDITLAPLGMRLLRNCRVHLLGEVGVSA